MQNKFMNEVGFQRGRLRVGEALRACLWENIWAEREPRRPFSSGIILKKASLQWGNECFLVRLGLAVAMPRA
jgi:hypothetical protein